MPPPEDGSDGEAHRCPLSGQVRPARRGLGCLLWLPRPADLQACRTRLECCGLRAAPGGEAPQGWDADELIAGGQCGSGGALLPGWYKTAEVRRWRLHQGQTLLFRPALRVW